MPASPVRSTVAATVALAVGLGPLVLSSPATAATGVPAVMVTEIVADNDAAPGASAHPDNFEYFEVHNTTGASIDLAGEGISFAYSYVDSPDTAQDVALAAEPLVLAAGETALLWLSYTASGLDSFAFDVDDFRAWHSVAPETQVVRVTGQAGMANGGNRGIRVLDDGAAISWSHAPSGAYGRDLAAHFRLPADASDLGLDVLAVNAPRTPGVVLPEAVVRPVVEPEPDPEPEPGPSDAAAWPLLVTEIAPDSTSYDNYEYFEVHNPTATAVDLQGEGFAFGYVNGSAVTPLAVEEPTAIAAGETVVFWLSYVTPPNIDAFAQSEADFRAAWGADDDVRIVRVTGQAGMANGGNRAIQITKGGAVVSSSLYPTGSVAAGQSAHFRIPAQTSQTAMTLLTGPAAASPGLVAAEALTFPAFDPQPDPALITAPLQVTELLPDSSNIGGADGYEFIEVYNATSTPVDFSDYSVNYLYPDTGEEALLPAEPGDVVIPAGETLVLWVKNGANGTLGAAEFNATFGTSLEAGVDLVEIASAGMANSGARGIEIVTNTGYTVSRALYNVAGADDTVADQGIRYTPSESDVSVQRMLGLAAATPGAVQRDQVPPGLMIVPADTVAPVITDLTAAEITSGSDFAVSVAIADDAQVKTVTLTLADSAGGAPRMINLTDAGDGVFTHVVILSIRFVKPAGVV